MNVWTGKYVSSVIGVDEVSLGEEFKSLAGLAFRDNPKRAHLVVSNVLGKHVPARPSSIAAAAKNLAHKVTAAKIPNAQKVAVIGYAETATLLGGLIHRYSKADYYIHSTRFEEGLPEYGSFEESHSHATQHRLVPMLPEELDNADVIVLVDDELTTGATVINTIHALHARVPHKQYIIATLVDSRKEEHRNKFAELAAELKVEVAVVSLVCQQLQFSALNRLAGELTVLRESQNSHSGRPELSSTVVQQTFPACPATRHGIRSDAYLMEKAKSVVDSIQDDITGRVLVLGTEEFMQLPFYVAYQLELAGKDVLFSTTTRSPAFAVNVPGYALRSRIKFQNPDDIVTPNRYAYNVAQGFDEILVVDNNENYGPTEALRQLTPRIREIFIPDAPVPLRGPLFGSYAASDVAWLLKDLSKAELEAPLEEREEAVQNGKKHYSESLPIEYQPTAEYRQLFQELLLERAPEIAYYTGVLAEQIYETYGDKVVLASLARAGTPVGVLLKRYLEHKHDVQVPHYAVSIVRGRGIDANALKHIRFHHPHAQIVFIDGWTGKGAIARELSVALDAYQKDTGDTIEPILGVLADPAHCTSLYGTRRDLLIPSSCLNSTVSGLVSRTVLNSDFITSNDFHGAKFYPDFAHLDVSNDFLDTITQHLSTITMEPEPEPLGQGATWAGWKVVEQLSDVYGIQDINLIKPGVGETTRVLLRRVPWKILINPEEKEQLRHILLLAESRGVAIEEVDNLVYSCIGLINPAVTSRVESDKVGNVTV